MCLMVILINVFNFLAQNFYLLSLKVYLIMILKNIFKMCFIMILKNIYNLCNTIQISKY